MKTSHLLSIVLALVAIFFGFHYFKNIELIKHAQLFKSYKDSVAKFYELDSNGQFVNHPKSRKQVINCPLGYGLAQNFYEYFLNAQNIDKTIEPIAYQIPVDELRTIIQGRIFNTDSLIVVMGRTGKTPNDKNCLIMFNKSRTTRNRSDGLSYDQLHEMFPKHYTLHEIELHPNLLTELFRCNQNSR